ncbi:biotin-dependent carboxylase uncharacterized domain-containing protein [Friedmanniella luteola]|uniref:Biotin-dependent carboxylase uncharacterized domain-containing protein n=1 Tax=Friedmanniella luteola TaxID=546871 RepID=A0A1H1YMF4_9ACTN|nr:biotin-dependent carboxyltransferase family protein [Friedmanniella luteola]SDT22515.1 biotin-dependent carboxylase uncharacterized domain-containing protein [Friedmanniella luteola]
MSAALVVEATGPAALLQDLGRPGLAHLGVSPSGAADRAAHRLANRLVGNDEGAATLEVTLGGLVVRATATVFVAVTGAPTTVRVDGAPTASHTTLVLRTGSRLLVEPPPRGLRNHVAVRGGLAVPAVLGSRSRDVLAGLGPAPLAVGDVLPVGTPTAPLPDADRAPAPTPPAGLAVRPGPRRDWFAADAWTTLLGTVWTVTADVDRVAVRLSGPALARTVTAELPSEGLVRGAVQVPASGQPLLFGPDHPVTGGYPVLAVLTSSAADAAAQLRPGDPVRFVG